MIRSLKVKSGYAKELPSLKGIIRFEPGLNILFGQNSCGKTSALAIMGAFCGCPHDSGGWSRFVPPFFSFENKKDKFKYPKMFAEVSPGHCTADVDWDGTATFSRPPNVGKRLFEDFDPLYSDDDMINTIFTKPSSGAEKAGELFRIEKAMQAPPDITIPPETIYTCGGSTSYKYCNDEWKWAIDEFTAHVKTLPRTGPPTLLLDEPDRSLSIPNTVGLWCGFLPRLAKTCQVVVASHSPFALDVPGANVIEMHEGYLDMCRKAMEKARGKCEPK